MTWRRQIVVAMSGGVDSSVAAALLHGQGHRVIGVTLRLLHLETGFGCCGSTRDIDDARAVCARLGVPHYVMDFSEAFQDRVIDPFVRTYVNGETPNPCISCNRFVKFEALLKKAVALGADAVATGHYARVDVAAGAGGRFVYRLCRAVDRAKDQSYVLYHLGQAQLSRLLFPVGDLAKPAVRDLARRWNLKTADKPDSQEICFVPAKDTSSYVRNHAVKTGSRTLEPGEIRTASGKLVGTHRGVAFYTRGQRHGLGLSFGKPVYVVDLDPRTNTVIVGADEETLSTRFSVREIHWTLGEPPAAEFAARVQIRSRHEAAGCHVRLKDQRAEVELETPQRAVTPGQSAVFYRDDRVAGGGIITSACPMEPRTGNDQDRPALTFSGALP